MTTKTEQFPINVDVLMPTYKERKPVELENRLRQWLKPKGEEEVQLMERIVADAWRLKQTGSIRHAMMEADLYEELRDMLPGRDGLSHSSEPQTYLQLEAQEAYRLHCLFHKLVEVQSQRDGDKASIPLVMPQHLTEPDDDF